MSLPRYSEYKCSGVEWLGDLPIHWSVHSLRHHLKAIFNGITSNQVDEGENTVPVTRIETISKGVIDTEKLGYISVEDARGDKLLIHGDILFSNINSLNMIGNCAQYCDDTAIYAGMNLLVLRPVECIDSSWLFWLIKSPVFRREVESRAKPAINQASIPQGSILSIQITTPTLAEQTAIATFLDRETAKIDALIAEQEKLLTLLAEKRQATISHAVTKGLNPDVPMKDSGVEWLGEVPAHWNISRLKTAIAKIESGVSVNAIDVPAQPGEVAVLKTSCVYSGVFRANENKVVLDEELDRVSCPVQAGTLIVSRMNTPGLVGAAGVVFESNPELFLPDRLWQVHLEGVVPNFIHYWMNTASYRTQVQSVCAGTSSSMQNLSQDDFRAFSISLPSIEEQQAIADFLERELPRLDALKLEATRAINLLKERRTALISAAVTGKIDVRHLAN